MPRKVRRSAIRSEQVPLSRLQPMLWPTYLLTALLAAGLGSGITYALLRPIQRPAQPVPIVSAASLAAAVAEVNAGDSAFNKHQWHTAVADYTQAIASGEDNPNVRTDLGTAYRNLHHPHQAIQEYQIAQREDPYHQNSLINEGIVTAFDLNHPSQGLAIWQEYLARFPHGQHVAAVKQMMAMVVAHTTPTQSASASH